MHVVDLEEKKKVKSEGTSIPDGKKIKNIEEEGYNYLKILEIDGANHVEIKYQMSSIIWSVWPNG